MKIILLSGGSGKRLWPLSNDVRSKQFLKLLTAPDGSKESMIQRVVRMIREAVPGNDIVIATGAAQEKLIRDQLGDAISVVTEPCRRDTFPAIMLACAYLKSQGATADEPVVVMPCDSYTDPEYFEVIRRMAEAAGRGAADMVLMGVEPTYPSAKYGYIVPDRVAVQPDGVMPVKRFTEKPDVAKAERLLQEGALWNGGVFAFRLGYLSAITENVRPGYAFASLRDGYAELPKISFDYAVVENADSVAVIAYAGKWKDLGTWNTLTDELEERTYGNVVTDGSETSYVINEMGIPVICIGAKDLVVVASPDGILVSDRSRSEDLKRLLP